MSNQCDHSERVTHNQNLYNAIDTIKYPDWAIIVMFYGAIHMVESVLAKENIHPRNHDERKDYIRERKDIFPSGFRGTYQNLETLSHQARYKPDIAITNNMVFTAQECIDEIKAWYKTKQK